MCTSNLTFRKTLSNSKKSSIQPAQAYLLRSWDRSFYVGRTSLNSNQLWIKVPRLSTWKLFHMDLPNWYGRHLLFRKAELHGRYLSFLVMLNIWDIQMVLLWHTKLCPPYHDSRQSLIIAIKRQSIRMQSKRMQNFQENSWIVTVFDKVVCYNGHRKHEIRNPKWEGRIWQTICYHLCVSRLRQRLT